MDISKQTIKTYCNSLLAVAISYNLGVDNF